jgi:hypothetical protein
MASAKSVRLPMYRSELAAEKTKRKMQALMMPGRTLMPAMMMATTKGEALALAAELLASLRSFEFQGTSQPMTMMPPM